jgi:predicted membrane protein
MNIWQIGFVVRSGFSAVVVAFLIGYAAHYQWGISRVAIRTDALLAALLIGTLVAIEFFSKNLRKPKK